MLADLRHEAKNVASPCVELKGRGVTMWNRLIQPDNRSSTHQIMLLAQKRVLGGDGEMLTTRESPCTASVHQANLQGSNGHYMVNNQGVDYIWVQNTFDLIKNALIPIKGGRVPGLPKAKRLRVRTKKVPNERIEETRVSLYSHIVK